MMSLTPLLQAGPVILLHSLAALLGLLLGILQLTLSKGTSLHRVVGYIWVTLLGAVALSSFWIHDLRLIGPFSPIHLLSIYTLINLFRSINAARRGNIAAHARAMRSIFFLALIGAGAFTLLPGRIMHQIVFGQ